MVAYAQQRPTPPLTSTLIALILVASIAATFGDGTTYSQLALIPRDVWRGELWRLVTWALIEPGPFVLIATCVAIYWCGGGLRSIWGPSRLSRFLLGIVLASGIGTSLLAPLVPMAWHFPQLGGLALAKALVIAWALEFPDRPVVVYWFVVTSGRPLAHGVLGVTVLCTFFFGIAPMLPELIACVGALFFMSKARRRWWLAFKAYRAQRKLDRHRRGQRR